MLPLRYHALRIYHRPGLGSVPRYPYRRSAHGLSGHQGKAEARNIYTGIYAVEHRALRRTHLKHLFRQIPLPGGKGGHTGFFLRPPRQPSDRLSAPCGLSAEPGHPYEPYSQRKGYSCGQPEASAPDPRNPERYAEQGFNPGEAAGRRVGCESIRDSGLRPVPV